MPLRPHQSLTLSCCGSTLAFIWFSIQSDYHFHSVLVCTLHREIHLTLPNAALRSIATNCVCLAVHQRFFTVSCML